MSRHHNVTDGQVGFRRRTTLDESPEAAREIRLAIARTKEGDRDALRLLYVRYSNNVYGYICSIVRDEQEAEDLTQHVFMKLITVIVQYKDHGVPFSGWLLRLARNVALDHLRRRRPTPTEEVYGPDEHADEESRHRARDLHSALASLPDEQREVMVMRHVVGLSPPEIAEQLGRTESSIHGLHHRGRRALQAELTRLGSSPSTATGATLAAA
ncbi:MAG TPA: RNA polymerase sigma factor [Solirubrobacteraceae bacterium]|jgi:RNA polymerase sigma-70 factor (ECF subfamily)